MVIPRYFRKKRTKQDEIKLTDGAASKNLEDGMTALEIAKELNQKLGRMRLRQRSTARSRALWTTPGDGATLKSLHSTTRMAKRQFGIRLRVMSWRRRLSASYRMRSFAIGPATDSGFYYDFDTEKPFTNEDLAKIEKEMKKS